MRRLVAHLSLLPKQLKEVNPMKLIDQAGVYTGQLHYAEAHSRPWLWLVALGWCACPFFIRTAVMNPSDTIWLQDLLQGAPVPHWFTAQQNMAGEFWAVIALAVLILLQLCMTVMFYRRSALDMGTVATPVLWPLAALLPGLLGNAAWYAWSGNFDLQGCLIGLSPTWLAFGGELIINRLGKNFIYGTMKNQLAQLPS
jgi:hypothetical protein